MSTLKEARKAKRLTQLQLALAAGLERSRIVRIEGGARTSDRTATRADLGKESDAGHQEQCVSTVKETI